jgi:hypothetical protein
MSTVKTKKVQLGTDATASNNFTLYQPATPDGTLRIGVGNADSPTEVGRFNSSGYVPTNVSCFSAYKSATQTISPVTWTLITLDTEDVDSNSDFDTSTSKFQPSIQGWYHINYLANSVTACNGYAYGAIYKNGSPQTYNGTLYTGAYVGADVTVSFSTLVFMNGTSDYLQLYYYQSATTSPVVNYGPSRTKLSGYLVRAT